MIQTVVKRDGRIVGFNEQKIMAAIRKAMLHTDKGEDERLLYQITDHIAQRGESQMTVEQIQDAVEVELMKSSRKDVAQKYIAYRHQRSVARKAKTREVFLDIVNIKNNDVTREPTWSPRASSPCRTTVVPATRPISQCRMSS